MDNREVYVGSNPKISQWYTVFRISVALDLIFMLIFPLTVFLLGYEDFSSNDWLPILLVITAVDCIGFCIYMGIAFLSKNKAILKENDKVLILEIPKNISVASADKVMVGNILYNNSNDIFSAVIGACLVANGMHESYQSINHDPNVDSLKDIQLKDILSLPLDYTYYENCQIIEQNKKYSLYSAKVLKKDGSFQNTKFKIPNYYRKVN